MTAFDDTVQMDHEAVYTDHSCDLCSADAPIEIACAREYTGNQPIHVCGACGFVYVRARRSAAEIARTWSDEIFGAGYTAIRNPAVMARQTFVAEFLASRIDVAGKTVCDIGAGEGGFLAYMKRHHGIVPFGVEPSARNCARLAALGIPSFPGTIEAFAASPQAASLRPDVVTIIWTLENCLSCLAMLRAAAGMLAEGGHVVVATGSRILVPFKKPLFMYFSTQPADCHCFRFSANALHTALALAGFRPVATNRYLDSDILCVLAEKAPASAAVPLKKDDPLEVLDFFERWHQESRHYVPERAGSEP